MPISDEALNRIRLNILSIKEGKYPWPQLCTEILDYHEEQQKTIGKAKAGRPSDDKKRGWGIRDSAKELGLSIGTLCEYLNLARLIKTDESLKEMKIDRALSIVRRKA